MCLFANCQVSKGPASYQGPPPIKCGLSLAGRNVPETEISKDDFVEYWAKLVNYAKLLAIAARRAT